MKRLSSRRFLRCERGSNAVEFCFVAVPLVLVFFGSIEIGRAFWTRQALYSAAMTGARCSGVPQTECASSNVRDTAKTRTFVIAEAAKWGLTIASANVALDAAATCGGATGFSKVSLTYTFTTAVPKLITPLVGTPLSVSACFPNSGS